MTKDLNKNISSIQYNSLNLPSKVVFSDGKYMDYVYSATGEKRSVTYNVLSSNGSYTYCDNFIYYNGDLNKILVDGGYISISGTTPTYHYYLSHREGDRHAVMQKGRFFLCFKNLSILRLGRKTNNINWQK